MLWKARHHTFCFPRPTLVMGIVNVTPDSFWDGGRYLDPEAAVTHGLRLIREGADLLDVGGESTRPGSTPVPEAEERRRVLPVVERLARETTVPVSIDTLKPGVAEAALEAGASIINDVAANREDPAMGRLVAASGAGYVAMHMRGTPATMQEDPRYTDVAAEVLSFFADRLDRLQAAGVGSEQIVFDVGIGFGKTVNHNLELLGRMADFTQLGRPLLLGVSRKSFLGRLSGAPAEGRLPGALAATCLAVIDGVAVIRTHDVTETVQALRVAEAILTRRRTA